MKKIGFIGAFDKTDFIIYIAKILTMLNNKVMVVDSTISQKAKYVVPVINPTKTYITTYEDIDVAVGFEDIQEIRHYLALTEDKDLEYDIILIDTDSTEVLENFDIKNANINFFVTSFDLFSLKKGLEILSGLKEPIIMTKILFSKDMLPEENDYLDFLSLGYKIIWEEERIYFPFETGDQSVIIENQRVSKIKFKGLSAHYKDSLQIIVEQILERVSASEVRKTIKAIEKGV